jgi:hypothetical protein
MEPSFDCGGDAVFFLFYVNDIQIVAEQVSRVEEFRQKLLSTFPGRDLGETLFFLQMSIIRGRSPRTVVLKQQRHIEKLVKEAGFYASHSLQLPMISSIYRDAEGLPLKIQM